ncbi:hypothetical protein ACMFMG_009310 [Clarireedia jacksonii]
MKTQSSSMSHRLSEDARIQKGQISVNHQSDSKENLKSSDECSGLPCSPNLITWQDSSDVSNPQNWSEAKKFKVIFIVSLLSSVSPLASSMTAPALPHMDRDLGIQSQAESQFTLSIFALGYAVGPLCLAPLSEIFGRVLLLQFCNLWFFVFNTACGFSRTGGQILAFRFLSGLGSSTSISIGAGVLGDCYQPSNLGTAAAIYSVMPVLGAVIGPIVGGFVSQNTTWRWIFWAVSIWDAVVQILALFVLHESFAPKILDKKLKKIQRETGNLELYTEHNSDRTLRAILARSAGRPLRFLGTQILVQALALYMAFLSGVLYIVESTFPTLWISKYGQPASFGSLNYIALGLGAIIGAQVCSYANDKIYGILLARNNGVDSPDFRLPTMLFGALLAPIGMFWYGWSAENAVHWAMTDVGGSIYCAGYIMSLINVHMYVIDYYGSNSASAIAAVTFVQSLFGGIFPLFGPKLYNTFGYGWGNSMMGFIALAIGVPAIGLLWRFGARVRSKSKYAAKADV